MEQLTRVEQGPAIRRAVVELMEKIEIRLSMEQLGCLNSMLYTGLKGALQGECDIQDKALIHILFKLTEKIRQKMLSASPKVKLKLELPQAWAVYEALIGIDLTGWVYEENVQRQIIAQITQQLA